MTGSQAMADVEGLIFDLDTFAVHDGPGIRMAVYLKGCPLACAWCHSPESQRLERQLIFVQDRCVACGACHLACARGVHSVKDGHSVAWEACLACGQCVAACPSRALAIKGYGVRAEDVVARAARMIPFFRHSGGGVTLTGGEVTFQPDFAEAVLASCRQLGIHTAVETCGASSWERLERLADQADLILYDIKLMDDGAHRRWTGAGNQVILRNARRLAGRNVQVRVPLIPGITDTAENVGAIYRFMAEAGLARAALLPYNPAAAAKYEWLGRDYPLQGEVQSQANLDSLVAMGRALGLDVTVG